MDRRLFDKTDPSDQAGRDNDVNAVNAVSLDVAPFTGDMVHESAKHALEQRKKFGHYYDGRADIIYAYPAYNHPLMFREPPGGTRAPASLPHVNPFAAHPKNLSHNRVFRDATCD